VSLKPIYRLLVFALLLPFLYLGTASAKFLYLHHSTNSARAFVRLAIMPPPSGGQRLLIFAPHPDDETLGCAGVIQHAGKSGVAVKVVFLTNGDGFRVAAERQFRNLHVGPEEFIHFATLRQQEALDALKELGLTRKDVYFLGYPDRGLMPLWNHHWSHAKAYQSPYTRCKRSPYALTFRREAPYCGQALLEDVKAIMRGWQPSDIYITHPSDDHPDHSAGAAFVSLAWRQLRKENLPWAARCRLHYYLVHRGDWPAPRGLYKQDQLVPPMDMLALDTHWQSLPLQKDEVEYKMRSILKYASQTAIMKPFLLSFARENELFGQIDAVQIPRVPEDSLQVDGERLDWRGISPAILDPVNDSLLRDLQGGGDVRAVYACRDTQHLYLRIDTYQPITPRVRFQLRLRYFGDVSREEAGGEFAVTIIPPSTWSSDFHAAIQGDCVEMAIPLREIGYSREIALHIETRLAGVQVDRTGYRFLDL